MRLTCPKCDTGYEIDDDVLSERGQVIKCWKCGHDWLQTRPPIGYKPETDEVPAPKEKAVASSNRELDPKFARVLQEEAARESRARRGLASARAKAKGSADTASDDSHKTDDSQVVDMGLLRWPLAANKKSVTKSAHVLDDADGTDKNTVMTKTAGVGVDRDVDKGTKATETTNHTPKKMRKLVELKKAKTKKDTDDKPHKAKVDTSFVGADMNANTADIKETKTEPEKTPLEKKPADVVLMKDATLGKAKRREPTPEPQPKAKSKVLSPFLDEVDEASLFDDAKTASDASLPEVEETFSKGQSLTPSHSWSTASALPEAAIIPDSISKPVTSGHTKTAPEPIRSTNSDYRVGSTSVARTPDSDFDDDFLHNWDDVTYNDPPPGTDVEDLRITPSEPKKEVPEPHVVAPRKSHAFRNGFWTAIVALAAAFLSYIYAPQIYEKLPQAAEPLTHYVEQVDMLRQQLGGMISNAADWVVNLTA